MLIVRNLPPPALELPVLQTADLPVRIDFYGGVRFVVNRVEEFCGICRCHQPRCLRFSFRDVYPLGFALF